MRLGCKPDNFRTVAQRLFGEQAKMGPGHENLHVELVRAGFDKGKRAGPNRSGRSKN